MTDTFSARREKRCPSPIARCAGVALLLHVGVVLPAAGAGPEDTDPTSTMRCEPGSVDAEACAATVAEAVAGEEESGDEGAAENGDAETGETALPEFSGYLLAELDQDWTQEAGEDALTELFAIFYGSFDLDLTEHLGLSLEIGAQSSGDGGYLAFEEAEVAVETLYATWSGEAGGVSLGKLYLLDDVFGNRQPGLFLTYPNEDLDLSGVIAVEGWLDLTPSLESYNILDVAVFYRDTSVLGETLFRGGRRLRAEDGGPANTESFDNAVVSLHGDELPFASNWEYALGGYLQSAGDGDTADETGAFAGVYGEYALPRGMTMLPIAELLFRDDPDGEPGSGFDYLLGASFEKEAWTFGALHSHRNLDFDDPGEDDASDNEVQVFASYAFGSGVYVDLGYQYQHVDGGEDHAVTLAIGITTDFSITRAGRARGADEKELEHIRRRVRQ